MGVLLRNGYNGISADDTKNELVERTTVVSMKVSVVGIKYDKIRE